MKRIIEHLIDDLDGLTEAAETVSFGLDGATYEIDLTTAHAKDLRDALAPFVRAGRRTSPAPRVRSRPTRDPAQGRAIREWAFEQGYAVNAHGRIPEEVAAAWSAAH